MISVIGGSGFIGTRLCKTLKEKRKEFKIFDKKKSFSFPDSCVIGDVRNLDSLMTQIADEDVIVNLAAEHRDDVAPKSLYYDVNVDGARNVCDVARQRNVKKIIFTSSVAVYGFADVGTDESGEIKPFNDYGKTKYQAEEVFREWQREDRESRSLVVIRPTVVFGEGNRGNVYNLLRQIASGRFVMIGNGMNRKSMAYVGNLVAFIEYCMENCQNGVHVYNFIDKPDFNMNTLVSHCRHVLTGKVGVGIRVPYLFGLGIGKVFDVLSSVTQKKYPISSIRVRKFCSDSSYSTAVDGSKFVRPFTIESAISRTLTYEFLKDGEPEEVFYTE